MRSKIHLFTILSLLLGMVLIDMVIGLTSTLLLVLTYLLLRGIERRSAADPAAEVSAQVDRLRMNVAALTSNPFESALFGIDTKVKEEIITGTERLATLESKEASSNSPAIRWLPAVSGAHITILLIQISLSGLTDSASIISLALLPMSIHVILFDAVKRKRL